MAKREGRMYVCMGFYGAFHCYGFVRQASASSVAVRMVHVVFSTAGFKGVGKPCPKTRETAALR